MHLRTYLLSSIINSKTFPAAASWHYSHANNNDNNNDNDSNIDTDSNNDNNNNAIII